MKGQKALFSHQSDEWSTPQYLFDELNAEFNFTIDAAATEENAKCNKFYTVAKSGLDAPWGGERVFVNPPYSEIAKWVEKAHYEAQNNGAEVVMLIPSRTDTRWFHQYIYGQAEIRFIKGRLSFGDTNGRAPFPSMIVVFRPRCDNT